MRGRSRPLVAMAVAFAALGAPPPAPAYLSDSEPHPAPAAGPLAYNGFSPSASSFPALGESYVDPVFGSTVRRLTDEFPRPSGSVIYGKNGFWSADGSRVLHYVSGAGWVVIDTVTGDSTPLSFRAGCDASFDPVDPDALWTFSGRALVRHSLAAGTATVARRFPHRLGTLGCSVDSISADGRYFLLAIGDRLRVWDRAGDRLYRGGAPTAYRRHDGWAGLSPDGRWIMVATRSGRNRSYRIHHGRHRVARRGALYWTLGGHHADLLTASDGRSYHLGFDDGAGIYRVDVSLRQRREDAGRQRRQNRRLLSLSAKDTGAGHFACAAAGPLRDWCFASIESGDDPEDGWVAPWRAYKQEILMINVLSGEVRRLAHHRSRGLRRAYPSQPRVSTDAAASRVGWTSNFNAGDGRYADLYSIAAPGAP